MKFETILIDIDNTLLDFGAAETIAFKQLLDQLNIEYSDELKAKYKTVNHQLWSDYEKGLIDSDAIKANRFARAFDAYDLNVNGVQMDAMYRENIENNNVIIKNAYELLNGLKDSHRLIIATNGIASSQYKRLDNAKMRDYFDFVAVSSELGATKPHQTFYDGILDVFPNLNPETTLILGDSLSADIQGGTNWGIKTCWFNPNKTQNTSSLNPDYEISDLLEVLKIVKA